MPKVLESFTRKQLDEVFLHPAIREVAFEIRFTPRLRVPAELWRLQDQFVDEYPNVGTEPLMQSSGSMLPVNTFQNPTTGRLMKVSQQNFVIAFTKYSNFEDFKEEALEKANLFCSTFEIKAFTRIGLRYINHIALPPAESASSLLKYVRPLTDFENLSIDTLQQFVNEYSLRHKDHMVTLRGVLLPPLRDQRRTYIFDIDCYSPGPRDAAAIEATLDAYHDTAQRFFLNHITEEYKDFMRGKQ